MTPDDLAEKLSEDQVLGKTYDANDAISFVDDYLNDPTGSYIDPTISVRIDAIQRNIDELNQATDEDIINIYFGGAEEVVPPAPGVAVETAAQPKLNKFTERELSIVSNRLNKRASTLSDQLRAQKSKLDVAKQRAAESDFRLKNEIENLEQNVASYKGKTGAKIKKAIASRKPDAIPSLTKELKKAARSITKKELDDVDNEDIARQIAQRIMGTPDGKLPYDWKMGEGSSTGKTAKISGLRGPLKSRTFQIPDNMIQEFLDNDIEDLGRMYLRQTAADIELTKKFGDVGMTDAFKELEAWQKTALEKAKTEKERLALIAAYDADIKDLAAMRDRIRGVYGDIDPNNIWVRTGS